MVAFALFTTVDDLDSDVKIEAARTDPRSSELRKVKVQLQARLR